MNIPPNNSDSTKAKCFLNVECAKCGFTNKLSDFKQTMYTNSLPDPFSKINHNKLPNGLEKFLLDFTVEILKKRPDNLNEFAYEYFATIKETDLMSADLNFKMSLGNSTTKRSFSSKKCFSIPNSSISLSCQNIFTTKFHIKNCFKNILSDTLIIKLFRSI